MTGREKCELLKTVRKKIAEENGIIYLSSECTYRGKCRGYCEKCDAEARYLESELKRLANTGDHQIVLSETYQSYLDLLHETNERHKSFPVEWETIFYDYEKIVDVKVLASPIESLGFSKKLLKLLKECGIVTIGDLREEKNLNVEKLGQRNVGIIVKKLKRMGIYLKYDFDDNGLLGVPIEDDDSSNNFIAHDCEVNLSKLGIKNRE